MLEKENKMDFSKILTKIRDIEEGKKPLNESLQECGMGMQQSPIPSMPPTPPVSMNVSLNAQGIDQIKDLLNLMNKADSPLAPGPVGMSTPAPMSAPIEIPMSTGPKKEPETMNSLDSLIKNAGLTPKAPEKKEADAPEKDQAEPGTKEVMSDVADEIEDMADELADKNKKEEEYANSPDEKIADTDAAIPSGDDLHKEKDAYPKASGGDNPMKLKDNIRSTLMQLYHSIKEQDR